MNHSNRAAWLLALAIAVPTAAALAQSAAAPTVLAAASPTAAQAPAAWKYKVQHLNRTQLDALLARPDQLLILDVRRPDELGSKGSFPVFLNIQADQLEQSLKFIPKDRAVVTVSNPAGRAGVAGDLLAAKGFKVAGAIGIANYIEEGGSWSQAAVVKP
ncbi:rhodanese-like domain-containing protein [uncultured Nevskia sp.]|uniref:rhodanese-like domain-containing protein n=1 Tax=uncultured Nevskia sp. TaxID=228950 RepID=UPI0025FB6E39|nr:rhodanese-like domain-containing protein [uncultured Nevskia sp.]